MEQATSKVTLSSSRDIPFNKLRLSQSNVRRIKAGISVEELAEDIARRGLLQSLNVRPVLDDEGKETDVYEIPAGGRRFRALELLVKQKRLSKTAPVPCVVRDPSTDILAEDDSLAENTQRAPLHPLDQFKAFYTMRQKGMAEHEIAAAFFTTSAVVKQRLRLASVAEPLLEAYAAEEMSLEQLMGFTVSSDHARQLAVWDSLRTQWDKSAHVIRRMLTEGAVKSSDRRARYIGIETYLDAGGAVERDLFQAQDECWLQDAALLDRLVLDKLKAQTEALASEGWKWAEYAVDFPYGHTQGLRPLTGVPVDLTDEERASKAALTEAFNTLTNTYDGADELPDDVDQRFAEIEAALEGFQTRPLMFAPDEVSRAGVFVSLNSDGQLRIERAFVKPEDEAPTTVASDERDDSNADMSGGDAPRANMSVAPLGQSGASSDDESEADDDVLKPLPDRLVTELTTYRTLALRNAVADHPHVALSLLLHKLCLDVFSRGYDPSCLEARVSIVGLHMQGPDLKDSPSASAVDERTRAWKERVPTDETELWTWLVELDDASRLALLAYIVSFGINAIYVKPEKHGAGPTVSMVEHRRRQADRLAVAVGLDMVQAGWRPTVSNYLSRVPKPRILQAVQQARGEQLAGTIGHLKKGDMAAEAERLLEGTGWLPEPLRGADSIDRASETEPKAARPDVLSNDADRSQGDSAEITAAAAE